MVGIEHRERQEERQHGEQMKRGDEPREQRDERASLLRTCP